MTLHHIFIQKIRSTHFESISAKNITTTQIQQTKVDSISAWTRRNQT